MVILGFIINVHVVLDCGIKWRVPDQDGERLCKKIVKHINWYRLIRVVPDKGPQNACTSCFNKSNENLI